MTQAWAIKWKLTDEHINSLQVDSVNRLIARTKHAHFTNVVVRINGKDETYEADWIKHMRQVTLVEGSAEPVAWRWRIKGAQTWLYDPDPEWLAQQPDSKIDKERVYTAPPADDARRLLERVHEFLKDPRHGQRKYVENGDQYIDMAELAQDIRDHLARSGK